MPRKALIDASTLARTQRMVAEEHLLLGKGPLSAAGARRLRQAQARLRPAEVVERYIA